MTLQTTAFELYFLKVQDQRSKCWRLYKTVQTHYLKGEKILILVSHWEAADFIDQLFWTLEEESFLPHAVSTAPCRELILITMLFENLNRASIAINLTNQPFGRFDGITRLYELYDETHPVKLQQSEARLQHYRSKGIVIEMT